MPSCLDWNDRFTETGAEIFMGSSKGYLGESCHLAVEGTPAGAAGRKRVGDGGGSWRFGLEGASTEHDTAGEDGRLTTIVVRHLILGVVNKDLCSACAFPTRHLGLERFRCRERVDALRVGEEGIRRRGTRRGSRVGGNRRVSGRPIDGGEGTGGGRGLDGREVGLDGGNPSWLSDVIGKDSKQFVLFSTVIFE